MASRVITQGCASPGNGSDWFDGSRGPARALPLTRLACPAPSRTPGQNGTLGRWSPRPGATVLQGAGVSWCAGGRSTAAARDQEGLRTDDPDLRPSFLRTVKFGSGGFTRHGEVEGGTRRALSGSRETGEERSRGRGHLQGGVNRRGNECDRQGRGRQEQRAEARSEVAGTGKGAGCSLLRGRRADRRLALAWPKRDKNRYVSLTKCLEI